MQHFIWEAVQDRSQSTPVSRLQAGIYRATAWLKGTSPHATARITAQCRFHVHPQVLLELGEIRRVCFSVHVKNSKLADGQTIPLLKVERRFGGFQWKEAVQIHISGSGAELQRLEMESAEETTTVLLAGDSTVADFPIGPQFGWGQFLQQFLGSNIAVANLAGGGKTLSIFRSERRWEKLLQLTRPGDYVLIQFGHNDMKETTDGAGPWDNYTSLLKSCVNEVRARNAMPILVTPVNRRKFDGIELQNTLGDYPQAVRAVAAAEQVTLIDLFATSKSLIERLGPKRSKSLFVQPESGSDPGSAPTLATRLLVRRDNTHLSRLGAQLMARSVAQSIAESSLPIASDVRPPEESSLAL